MTICFTIKASEIVVWSCFGAAIGRKKERKKKYFIKFIESWSQKFKFIQKSRKGENYALCTVCGFNFSIGNGGENDISKHNSKTKTQKFFGFDSK